MNSVSLVSGWKCRCGATFEDAHQAYLHRDGTDYHQVSPSVSRMSGIEREQLQNEIQSVGRK
jgi:hypothetical protein